MKPTRRKRRLATILLFPLLAIAFLVGFELSVFGERQAQKVKTREIQDQKPIDNVTLGVIPQELTQTH